jgi:hypothetical protein
MRFWDWRMNTMSFLIMRWSFGMCMLMLHATFSAKTMPVRDRFAWNQCITTQTLMLRFRLGCRNGHVQLRRIGINDGEADTEFKAGGDDNIETPRHPSNPSVLELTGFVLGRVEISHKIQDSNNGPEVWDLLVFARSLLYDHTIYPTGDPLDKVIMSTTTQVDKSHDIRAFHDLLWMPTSTS